MRCSLSTLVPCPLVIVTVGCGSGTSGKLGGTSVELVAVGDSKVADCPLVAGCDVEVTSCPLTFEPLALAYEPTQSQWKTQCQLCSSK